VLYQIRDDQNLLAIGVEEAQSAQDALIAFLLDRRAADEESIQLQADGTAVVWRGTRYTAVPARDTLR
jgi:hypothetical protein